jgi:hypothetical protein
MADLLGWDAGRMDAEITSYRNHVREVKTFLPELDTVTTARVAHA